MSWAIVFQLARLLDVLTRERLGGVQFNVNPSEKIELRLSRVKHQLAAASNTNFCNIVIPFYN